MINKILHKYLKLPYILAIKEFQSPKHPSATVILLHGIGSSLSMWEPLGKNFPENVRIIGIDLLGFGHSPKPEWGRYDTRVQADSIATTLVRHRISGPLVLVGHSLGSLVAIEFARRYSRSVKSLVLISPPIYMPDRNPKRFEPRPEEIIRKMYQLMAENPKATKNVLRLAGTYNLLNKGFQADTVDVPAYLATLEAAIINQQSYRDILRLTQPIHIITGKLDALVLDATIQDIAKKRPNIALTSVLGSHEIIGAMRRATLKQIAIAIDQASLGRQDHLRDDDY